MVGPDGGATQPGLMVGPTSEFSLFFRVKDGEGPSLRAALLKLRPNPVEIYRRALAAMGRRPIGGF